MNISRFLVVQSNILFQLCVLFLAGCCIFSSCSMALAAKTNNNNSSNNMNSIDLSSSGTCSSSVVPPIVYTIAGSDSGGGAGIQADLHAIHAMKCHGCSAITCLTAQNSVGVTEVHAPPATFLQRQLETLLDDLPPKAIKIGMLGTKDIAVTVGAFLQKLHQQQQEENGKEKVWVVLDPVMISTSGHKLIDDDAKEAIISQVFPYADILTPNKYEAEELLGRTFESNQDVENGAKELLKMGVGSVLIKGGHTSTDIKYAQDYFLSSKPPVSPEEPRLFESSHGVWLRSPRYETDNTHGTGCTLSSAMASALALGEQERASLEPVGSTSSIDLIDACVLAKAYVTAGIFEGVQYGQGPGPVAHTEFPSTSLHFPSLTNNPSEQEGGSGGEFCAMKSYSDDTIDDRPVMGRILPVVDTVEWVQKLVKTPGITDIQLRIKDETDPVKILERSKEAQKLCQAAGVRLWINDHWEAAVGAGCFGVHVGQEDLVKCIESNGVEELRKSNMALGISTHSYAELAAALSLKPSYISLGPVFATRSKNVRFDPQGLSTVTKFRELIPDSIPFVAIGGINDAGIAEQVRQAGADSVAVIGAVTQAQDLTSAVSSLNEALV